MSRLREVLRREWQDNGELIIFLAANLLLVAAVITVALVSG